MNLNWRNTQHLILPKDVWGSENFKRLYNVKFTSTQKFEFEIYPMLGLRRSNLNQIFVNLGKCWNLLQIKVIQNVLFLGLKEVKCWVFLRLQFLCESNKIQSSNQFWVLHNFDEELLQINQSRNVANASNLYFDLCVEPKCAWEQHVSYS